MHRLAGAWNLTYSMAAVLALYLNVFVLTAQFFAKLPLLKAMAPTQSEAPFNVAQLGGLMLFITLGILVAKSSRSRQLSIT
jgi:hypothetical protein